MPEYDTETRALLAYDRCKWLSAVSFAGILITVASFTQAQTIGTNSLTLLVIGMVLLAFTLFISTGIQIVASAADRWGSSTASPMLLVMEWRVLAAAHFALMLSGLFLLTYLVNNLPVAR